MSNIMVDLETMDNSSTSAITAIGAVSFGSGGLGEEFYAIVDLQSSVDAGLTMSADTIMWWMKQSVAARKEITKKGESLESALNGFTAYLKKQGDLNKAKLWGNGANFDNPILSNAYKAAGIRQPWRFYNDRCYRTMKAMFGNNIEYVQPEIPHHALEDAKAQARHMIKIMIAIQGG